MCDGRNINIVSISGQYRLTGETEHVVVVASSVHFVYRTCYNVNIGFHKLKKKFFNVIF